VSDGGGEGGRERRADVRVVRALRRALRRVRTERVCMRMLARIGEDIIVVCEGDGGVCGGGEGEGEMDGENGVQS